jgi:WXG100 family type VII secretion target
VIDHLEVTPARLATAAENIADAGRSIDDVLETLRTEATALAGRWSGDAQEAYLLAQSRFDQSATSRTEVLQLMCDALVAVAVAYGDTDLDGARALGATP